MGAIFSADQVSKMKPAAGVPKPKVAPTLMPVNKQQNDAEKTIPPMGGTEADLMALLQGELVKPLEEMRSLARTMEQFRLADKLPAGMGQTDAFRRLTVVARETVMKLDAAVKLAEVGKSSYLIKATDRSDLVALVRDAAAAHKIQAIVRGPEELAKHFSSFGAPTGKVGLYEDERKGAEPPSLPPVYGSSPWLIKAFGIYLKAIAAHLQGGRPEVTIRIIGDHLLVSIGCALGASEAQLNNTSSDEAIEIEMALANRIIQLHGGEVRQKRGAPKHAMDCGAPQQILVSLPTGGGEPLHPPLEQCRRCPAVVQNLKMAADFEELLSRLDAATTTPSDTPADNDASSADPATGSSDFF